MASGAMCGGSIPLWCSIYSILLYKYLHLSAIFSILNAAIIIYTDAYVNKYLHKWFLIIVIPYFFQLWFLLFYRKINITHFFIAAFHIVYTSLAYIWFYDLPALLQLKQTLNEDKKALHMVKSSLWFQLQSHHVFLLEYTGIKLYQSLFYDIIIHYLSHLS